MWVQMSSTQRLARSWSDFYNLKARFNKRIVSLFSGAA